MISFKCFLPAWIAAWVVAVFVPSVLIALFGPPVPGVPVGEGLDNPLMLSWSVADEMSPAAKLTIGIQFLFAFLALDRLSGPRSPHRYVLGAVIAVAAMAAAIAFIPAEYLRGFAIAITGTRFDMATTPFYLIGGVLAGMVFVYSSDRCRHVTP